LVNGKVVSLQRLPVFRLQIALALVVLTAATVAVESTTAITPPKVTSGTSTMG